MYGATAYLMYTRESWIDIFMLLALLFFLYQVFDLIEFHFQTGKL